MPRATVSPLRSTPVADLAAYRALQPLFLFCSPPALQAVVEVGQFFALFEKARNGKQRPLAETYVDACIERGAAMLRMHSSQRLVALIALVIAAATLLVAATTPSSRNAMINALGSSDPNPTLGDEAKSFDRLVGTWDADFSFPRKDGSVLRKKGELHFGWVMDGTAIHDLWIGYPAEAGKERSVGTTLRFFDGQSKQWRIVFINPRFNDVVTAQGRGDGEDIVFHGTDTDGLALRSTSVRSPPIRSTGRARSPSTAARRGESKRTIA
jgi:hypothetical protein